MARESLPAAAIIGSASHPEVPGSRELTVEQVIQEFLHDTPDRELYQMPTVQEVAVPHSFPVEVPMNKVDNDWVYQEPIYRYAIKTPALQIQFSGLVVSKAEWRTADPNDFLTRKLSPSATRGVERRLQNNLVVQRVGLQIRKLIDEYALSTVAHAYLPERSGHPYQDVVKAKELSVRIQQLLDGEFKSAVRFYLAIRNDSSNVVLRSAEEPCPRYEQKENREWIQESAWDIAFRTDAFPILKRSFYDGRTFELVSVPGFTHGVVQNDERTHYWVAAGRLRDSARRLYDTELQLELLKQVEAASVGSSPLSNAKHLLSELAAQEQLVPAVLEQLALQNQDSEWYVAHYRLAKQLRKTELCKVLIKQLEDGDTLDSILARTSEHAVVQKRLVASERLMRVRSMTYHSPDDIHLPIGVLEKTIVETHQWLLKKKMEVAQLQSASKPNKTLEELASKDITQREKVLQDMVEEYLYRKLYEIAVIPDQVMRDLIEPIVDSVPSYSMDFPTTSDEASISALRLRLAYILWKNYRIDIEVARDLLRQNSIFNTLFSVFDTKAVSYARQFEGLLVSEASRILNSAGLENGMSESQKRMLERSALARFLYKTLKSGPQAELEMSDWEWIAGEGDWDFLEVREKCVQLEACLRLLEYERFWEELFNNHYYLFNKHKVTVGDILVDKGWDVVGPELESRENLLKNTLLAVKRSLEQVISRHVGETIRNRERMERSKQELQRVLKLREQRRFEGDI